MTTRPSAMTASTLTLPDVAELARVRRPVVSMWRRRERVGGELIPFPAAIEASGPVERFDLDEVVAWLEETGRGNNDHVRLDAVAAAVPEGTDLDDVVSLLCLTALSAAELAGREVDDLLDLADDLDPDDEFLFSEIEELTGDAGRLASYVDALLSTAYSPADALDRLERSRLGRFVAGSELGTEAVRLLGTVTAALAGQLGSEPVGLIDASAGRTALALQVAGTWPEGLCRVFGVAGSEPAARRLRRTGLLRGLDVQPEPGGAAVVVLSVAGAPPAEAIQAVDELQLSLPEDRIAVVVGPASLLCDVPTDPRVEQHRDEVVRTGTLRLAARLPRGLWPSAPRLALGLWVFGTQTARRVEDRAIALCDLSDVRLSDAAVDDLATDAVASLGRFRAHAFRFARVVATSKVIASRSVVDPGVRPARFVAPSAAERQVHIDALLDTLTGSLATPTISPSATGGSSTTRATIGELIGRRALKLQHGARLDRSLAHLGGSVRIVDPVTGRSVDGFDPIELEHRHPRALRTEPGDVVFTHTPRPAATVDTEGGSLAASPARVLRLTSDAPIGPYAVALTINRQDEGAREWRGWHLPLVAPREKEYVERALEQLHGSLRELQHRVTASAELAGALVDGVAAGAVSLIPAEQTGG